MPYQQGDRVYVVADPAATGTVERVYLGTAFPVVRVIVTFDDGTVTAPFKESDLARVAKKCQYAPPGTYGHECDATATHVIVTVMSQDTKTALHCMGAKVPSDGLSRAGRCETHRNVREFGDGAFVRNE